MAEEFKKRQEKLIKLVLEFEMHLMHKKDIYHDSEFYEKIVKWYIDNYKFKKALNAVEFALSQHSFSSDLLLLKANILIGMQKFEDSIKVLNHAHSLNPTDENIFILKGQVLVILGKSKEFWNANLENSLDFPKNMFFDAF